MQPVHAVILGLAALLIQWIIFKLRVESKKKREFQESCVHNWHRRFAYDNPRWPYDVCVICGLQEQRDRINIPCPHCGKEISDRK